MCASLLLALSDLESSIVSMLHIMVVLFLHERIGSHLLMVIARFSTAVIDDARTIVIQALSFLLLLRLHVGNGLGVPTVLHGILKSLICLLNRPVTNRASSLFDTLAPVVGAQPWIEVTISSELSLLCL